jgi:CheY-like chemotaxis protein
MQLQTTNHRGRDPGRLTRILAIDDEAGFTRLLKINLEATGRFVVRTENDPRMALPAALDFHPDLVLLDVMMPGFDGGDVATTFASDPRLNQIPIVFLTATVRHSEVDAHDGCFGGLRFLSKPVALPELLACLDEILGGIHQHV